MDFAPAPAAALSDRLTVEIDAAIVARQRAEYEAGRGSGIGDVAKKRIGSGYIGVECGRALAYRFHRAEKEERPSTVSPGALQRHALSGHWTESAMADWLRLIGFDLHTHRPVVEWRDPEKPEQFGYKAARDDNGQARIAGEIDGVIVGVPAALADIVPAPCLWESKKATAKKFAKFAKDGVRTADAAYFGQLQTNMAYMDVHHALFTMLNLDSMAIYAELIAIDVVEAQRLTDRAVKVLGTATPEEMPRISRDPHDQRCRFCDYHGQCWKPAAATPKQVQAPPWARTAS